MPQDEHTRWPRWWQAKMLRSADNKVSQPVTFQCMDHFGCRLVARATKESLQTFHASDFTHGSGGNCKSEAANGKQDHALPCAPAWQDTFGSHSAPTFAAPKMYSTRFSIAA